MLGTTAALQPGASAFVRLMLREPTLVLPGDRFIIRMFSPVVTIGGGVVLDTAGVRYRRSDNPAERLDVLAGTDLGARVALLVRESGFGMSIPAIVARTGLRESAIDTARFVFLKQPQPWLVDRGWFQSARERMVRVLREFHQQQPLQPGIAKQDLRARELAAAPPFLLDAILADAKDIAVEGETVRLRSHRVVLKEDEEQARAKIEGAFEQAGLAVPAVAEVLAKSGVEAARARSLLQILIPILSSGPAALTSTRPSSRLRA
jgi:selenocysteine-specific elongation factor